MEIREAKLKCKSFINRVKPEYEAAIKLEEALTFYEELEDSIKQMKSDAERAEINRQEKLKQEKQIEQRLIDKKEEFQKSVTKAGNENNEQIARMHNKTQDKLREMRNYLSSETDKFDQKVANMDDTIKQKGDIINKMEKLIEQYKKDYGSIFAS